MSRARERIGAAISALVVREPFFGTLALGHAIVESTDPSFVDTAATDGRTLWYWPGYVDGLRDSQLLGLMAHEVMHPALGHHVRRKGRDPKQWNVACDIAIDAGLVDAGFDVPDAWIEPQFTGLSAEEIYAARARAGNPEKPGKPGQAGQGAPQAGKSGQGGAPGAPQAGKPATGSPQGAAVPSGPGKAEKTGGRPGGVLDAAPDHDPAGLEAAALETETRVRQAVAVARAAGRGVLPSVLSDLVKQLGKPRRDWREELARFIEETSVRDFTWSRPNRRFVHAGLYLPGMQSEALGELVSFVDISGSVTRAEQEALAAENQAALDSGRVERITIVYADNKVRHVDRFERGDKVTLRAFQGGGTDFSDSFAWLERNAPDAAVVLYLTDLETRSFGKAPACPVLWCRVGRSTRKPPFGDGMLDLDPAA